MTESSLCMLLTAAAKELLTPPPYIEPVPGPAGQCPESSSPMLESLKMKSRVDVSQRCGMRIYWPCSMQREVFYLPQQSLLAT
eukprot:3536505-Rhodomonas_salina.4